MKVATWNVNSLRARMPRFLAWLDETEPDVVCIQETKLRSDSFPRLQLEQLGYESADFGQGQWNGVAVISRVGMSDPILGIEHSGELEEARAITVSCNGVVIVSVYVPNGRALDSDHYRYKLQWLSHLREHLDKLFKPSDPVVVAGDFNVAPEDKDVWSPEALIDCTHVSEPERDAFRSLIDWGLSDALRHFYDQDQIFTWWDHRAGAFHKRQGMRIDHILVTEPIESKLNWAIVDRNARKGEKPSDHAPVLIDFSTP
ncbi:MAG: exodeoxyribonuclease III [Actinomycetota bacterium]|nr:MAG: exodeoxyribonuclease III [Actinomycetota bacterium]